MNQTTVLETSYGHRLAYQRWQGVDSKPGLLFLGGFRSDMMGTKAQFLMQFAKSHDQSCLIFDYTGHGQSSGVFEEGLLSHWLRDAVYVLENLTSSVPQIIIGSSMGGWLALLLARRFPNRFKGFIGVACAPDFTHELLEKQLTDEERVTLESQGHVEIRSGPFSHPVSKALIEDGRSHLVLGEKLTFPFPVHLIHGTKDEEVPYAYSQRVMDRIQCPSGVVHLIQGGDHRLNRPDNLALMGGIIQLLS